MNYRIRYRKLDGLLYSLLFLLIAGTVACSNAGEPQVVEDKDVKATPVSTPLKANDEDAIPTITPVVEQDSQEAEPSTPTQLPTRMATSTASPVPVTPSPTIPPAPHFNVDQAPYEASECSDKYPCNEDVAGWEARMRVPPGFQIHYFARVDDLPTSLTFGQDGNLYVAGAQGTIYQINPDGQISEYADGFLTPTGIAFQPGTDRLYVSNRVMDANVDGEAQISVIEEGKSTTIIAGLPCCYVGMHGPNGIAFGPDGFGYVGVGGRADHGEKLVGPDQGEINDLLDNEAAILRFSPDGTIVERFAGGFRNPYDIVWDAEGRLYATDNGRDGNYDDDNPPDELHQVIPFGEHGYPWFECPVCFGIPDDIEVIAPIAEFIPHGAVAGITVYLEDTFKGYYDDLFVVLWSAFPGAQKIARFGPDREEFSDFATGFAQPIDLTVGPEGYLYVADYATGIIFQIGLADE